MRKLLLIFSLLLVVVTSITACSEKYCCKYYISDICADQRNNLAYLEFELDEDEVLSGKISVDETFASVVFFYSEPDLIHILKAAEDPVIIGPMREYSFKIKANQQTRVRCYFLYKNWPVILGDFLCNITPVETWVKNSDSPHPPWNGPTMHSPPPNINSWMVALFCFVVLPLLIWLPSWLHNKLSRRNRQS